MLSPRTLVGLWLIWLMTLMSSQLRAASPSSLPSASNAPPPASSNMLPQLLRTEQLQTAIAEYEGLFSYNHNLSIGQQQRALVSMGVNVRLRRLLSDLQAGNSVSIGILGGSVSWGFYMKRGVNDWFALFTSWLQQAFPAAKVASKNGCVPATTAEYASMCLDKFVDTQHVDLVFLEYSLNDGYVDTSVKTEHAMAFERLIRKLMQLPRQPAVVLMQVLPQGIRASAPPFWWSVQDHYGVLAQYYQLPWLSMRDAMWHEVVAGTPGFTVPEIYPEQEQDMQRHPSELGHKYMADVAVAMMQQVYLDMLLEPLPAEDTLSKRLMQVPEPMFDGNYESSNLACFIGDALPTVVVASDGWSWRNDGTADKPKWGFSTSTVGAVLRIQLDTRMQAQQQLEQGAPSSPPADSMPPVDSSTASDRQVTVAAAAAPVGSGEASSAAHSSKSSRNKQPSQLHSKQHQTHHSMGHAARHEQTPTMHPQVPPSRQADRNLLSVGSIQPNSAAATTMDQDTASPNRPRFNSALSGSHHPSPGVIQQQEEGHTVLEEERGSQQQQHSAGDLRPLPRYLQQVDRSTDWWEAQQAQEEQQERSKLAESNVGWQAGDILVWVGYTKTWRGGGRAVMDCVGGCSCRNITVDGHHRWKTTQSFMAKLYTQQAADCTIQVTVLPTSSSNGTYFKVSGVMVTRRISSYDNGDYTDVLLLNAMEGEEYKLKTEG